MSWRSAVVGIVVVGLAALPAGPARGDWPVGRHDAQRTGAAEGISNIVTPETRWRYYLGGSLSPTGVVAVDVDSDGVEEYVMAAGGALVARRFDDSVVWRVAPRDINTVVAVSDLDGDGRNEIVVGAGRGALVVDAMTGAIVWETPADLLGSLAGIRIADLDGDQLDDLVIVPCGPCCAVPSNWPGAAYGFAAGRDQPVELWQLPQATCGQINSLTLFDSDGDGALEVLVATEALFQLLDGATGAELARTQVLGTAMQIAMCTPIDVDGTPGDELACIHNHPTFPADRSVFVLDRQDPSLQVLWRTFLANQPTDELRTIELAVDLGSGPRLVTSARSGPDASWSTSVVDAVTGAATDVLAGELLAGTAPRQAGGRYLLTASTAGMRGWQDVGGVLREAWLRSGDEDPLIAVDRTAARRGAISDRAAVLPATGRLLVVPRSSVNTLRSLSFDDTGVALESEIFLALNVRVAAVFLFPEIAQRPFGMSRSDGYLTPLDEELVSQLGADDVQLAGIRTGGYHATGTFRQLAGPPRAADLDDDGFDEIVVGDARGALVRLDPEHGSLTVPPRPRWVIAETTAPAVTRDAQGRTALACIERDTTDPFVPTYAVSLRSPDAGRIWSSPLPGVPMADVIPGSFDDDGVPDLVVQWGSSGNVLLQTRALSGSDGAVLWENVSDPGAGRSPAGVATGPWTGQELDVVVGVGATRVSVLSGPVGALVSESAFLGIHYFLPMLADVDEDSAREVALTGGFWPLHLLDHDLTTMWISSDADQHPYPYGALARCPDGRAILISQSWQYPARLTMTTLSPADRGVERTLWLAGGDAYADAAILDEARVWAGQLTSSTVHQDLSGTGRPSALVGSSDGYLYFIDPCEGAFDTAVRFDAAVGEAVFADTDGDGLDEILVTVGDGELHALQHHAIDPPVIVRDLDLAAETGGDVDELANDTALSARWDLVAGATGYQAALVDRQGQYATSPPWRTVSEPHIVFDDVETSVGEFYRVAVRAVRPEGRSVDVASDGVITVAPDDSGTTPGGCCDSGRPGHGALVVTLLVLMLRPRRRQRNRTATNPRSLESH